MVLITADGKVVIIVNKDTLSTSEGLGTIPRGVTGWRKRAVASMELPQNRETWPLSCILFPLSAKTPIKVSGYLYAFWITVTETHLNQLWHKVGLNIRIMECFRECQRPQEWTGIRTWEPQGGLLFGPVIFASRCMAVSSLRRLDFSAPQATSQGMVATLVTMQQVLVIGRTWKLLLIPIPVSSGRDSGSSAHSWSNRQKQIGTLCPVICKLEA